MNSAAKVMAAASASLHQPPGRGSTCPRSSPAPKPLGRVKAAASANATPQDATCISARVAARARSNSKRTA